MMDPAIVITRTVADSYDPEHPIWWPPGMSPDLLILNVDGCVVVFLPEGGYRAWSYVDGWVDATELMRGRSIQVL